MKLRWSNGTSAAVEFEAHDADSMADAMCDALIEYRQQYGEWRVELHVNVAPDRWNDPSGLAVPDDGRPHNPFRGHTGFCHVINVNGRQPADPDDSCPVVRGTDYVLIVGPGAWHGPELFSACLNSVRYYNSLCGLGADVADVILKMQNPDQ